MKKNPHNIAILSSSPLMMMLGIKLQKDGHRVKVFDFSKNIGGAWTWYQKNHNHNEKIPKYTNIINPYNQKEVRFTDKMNSFLKKEFKIKIKKTQKKFDINYNYKNKFIYNFGVFFDYASKKLKFIRKFISKIETLQNGKVKINNKFIFDKVFIPSFSGVKSIKIHNKRIFYPEKKEIVSEHLSIIAKKFKLQNFYYSQFFDVHFDRVKIEKLKKYYCLTARLDHSIKGTKIIKLKKHYIEKFVKKNDLINIKVSKFHNYYRNKNQLSDLKDAIKNTNIEYVDTTQFMCGFYSLRKILNVNKL